MSGVFQDRQLRLSIHNKLDDYLAQMPHSGGKGLARAFVTTILRPEHGDQR
jgi:hypothetical protein